jgi:CheY-like chemotaxis protein
MADDKGLSLSFYVQGDLTLDRYGDYGKLRQILINIMGNAIKFTHSGQVELTILQGALENELTFNLGDTGDGISEEQIEHIFTAYHQVPGSHNFRQEGSGLGLSISNTLTTIMGGTLSVESELGKGSHFTLHLPLMTIISHHKKDSHTTRTINPVDLSGKCILVVDDSDVNQEVVCAFLSSTGIKVVAVKDGKQALDRFQLGGIDIVLMDLHMDVMGGITATSRIREFEANNSIEHCPIILHTADTGEEVLHQANQAGVDHFLYKPYSQVQLLSTLCEFIDLEFDSQAVDVVEVSQMKPLVDKFLEDFNTSLNTCHRHIEHNDFEALDQEIHQMLGNCGVFGATSMFATLTEVKTLLNENKIDPLPMLALLATVTEQLLVYRQTGKQY